MKEIAGIPIVETYANEEAGMLVQQRIEDNRYDKGDIAIYQKGNEVSKGWDYSSELYGRCTDLIYDVNGQPVHPMNFARILKNLPRIVQWQFVQKEHVI